jgi:hypothetical protein
MTDSDGHMGCRGSLCSLTLHRLAARNCSLLQSIAGFWGRMPRGLPGRGSVLPGMPVVASRCVRWRYTGRPERSAAHCSPPRFRGWSPPLRWSIAPSWQLPANVNRLLSAVRRSGCQIQIPPRADSTISSNHSCRARVRTVTTSFNTGGSDHAARVETGGLAWLPVAAHERERIRAIAAATRAAGARSLERDLRDHGCHLLGAAVATRVGQSAAVEPIRRTRPFWPSFGKRTSLRRSLKNQPDPSSETLRQKLSKSRNSASRFRMPAGIIVAVRSIALKRTFIG